MMCPPRKNRQQKATKNGMNRNNSFVFIEAVAFIPRFAWQRASANVMMRRKNKAAPRAVRLGTSLSYRLLIVKQRICHKRSAGVRMQEETAN